MSKGLLPLGSVVSTKNKGTLLCVIGYYPIVPTSNEVYTYICSNYPFGIGKQAKVVFISEDAIQDIVFWGFVNTDAQNYYRALPLLKDALEGE